MRFSHETRCERRRPSTHKISQKTVTQVPVSYRNIKKLLMQEKGKFWVSSIVRHHFVFMKFLPQRRSWYFLKYWHGMTLNTTKKYRSEPKKFDERLRSSVVVLEWGWKWTKMWWLELRLCWQFYKSERKSKKIQYTTRRVNYLFSE